MSSNLVSSGSYWLDQEYCEITAEGALQKRIHHHNERKTH